MLSALIVIHESTWFRSGLIPPGRSVGAAAAALPASADPASEKPTISAPPPLTNDLRENSFSCMQARHHAPAFAITAAAFWIAVRIRG